MALLVIAYRLIKVEVLIHVLTVAERNKFCELLFNFLDESIVVNLFYNQWLNILLLNILDKVVQPAAFVERLCRPLHVESVSFEVSLVWVKESSLKFLYLILVNLRHNGVLEALGVLVGHGFQPIYRTIEFDGRKTEMWMVTVEYAAFDFFLLGLKVHAIIFQVDRAFASPLARLFLFEIPFMSIWERWYFYTISSALRTQRTPADSLTNEANFSYFVPQRAPAPAFDRTFRINRIYKKTSFRPLLWKFLTFCDDYIGYLMIRGPTFFELWKWALTNITALIFHKVLPGLRSISMTSFQVVLTQISAA